MSVDTTPNKQKHFSSGTWMPISKPFQARAMSDIRLITEELIKFRDARQWEQFHDSKNLALAISIEAAELNELFLWKNGVAAEDIDFDRLKEELADIFSFCFLLAAKHHLDVRQMVIDKIQLNEKKYPVEKATGTAKKYNEL